MAKIQDLEEELDKAIKATDDPKDRAMLMIMQKVLVHVEKLLSDEETLRMKVLNGDYHNHSDDHDYIAKLREINAVQTIKWGNTRVATGGYCDYVLSKIKEEQESSKTFKDRWNRLVEGLISDLPKVLLYVLATLAGYGWLIK